MSPVEAEAYRPILEQLLTTGKPLEMRKQGRVTSLKYLHERIRKAIQHYRKHPESFPLLAENWKAIHVAPRKDRLELHLQGYLLGSPVNTYSKVAFPLSLPVNPVCH